MTQPKQSLTNEQAGMTPEEQVTFFLNKWEKKVDECAELHNSLAEKDLKIAMYRAALEEIKNHLGKYDGSYIDINYPYSIASKALTNLEKYFPQEKSL